MKKSLKNFGMGLVYILILPLIVLATILIGIYGVFSNIRYFYKGILRFFKGETFFEPLPEDVELKHLLRYNDKSAREAKIDEPSSIKNETVSNNTTYIQNNYYQNSKPANNDTISKLNNDQNAGNLGMQTPNASIDYSNVEQIPEAEYRNRSIDYNENKNIIDVKPDPIIDINNMDADEIKTFLDNDPFFVSTSDGNDGGDE